MEEYGFSGSTSVYANSKKEGRGTSVVFMIARATIPPLDHIRNLVIVAQWLSLGMSKIQIETAFPNGGLATIERVEFDRLADMDLEGQYCIVIVDHPHEHYLARLTTESFVVMKRLTQTAGVLWITGGLLLPDAGLVRGLARTLRAEFQINRLVTCH